MRFIIIILDHNKVNKNDKSQRKNNIFSKPDGTNFIKSKYEINKNAVI